MLKKSKTKSTLPFRTILHSLQTLVISSFDELKSRAQIGEDVKGALRKVKVVYYYII